MKFLRKKKLFPRSSEWSRRCVESHAISLAAQARVNSLISLFICLAAPRSSSTRKTLLCRVGAGRRRINMGDVKRAMRGRMKCCRGEASVTVCTWKALCMSSLPTLHVPSRGCDVTGECLPQLSVTCLWMPSASLRLLLLVGFT